MNFTSNDNLATALDENGQPLIDSTVLNGLTKSVPPAMVNTIIASCVDDIREKTDLILHAADNGQWEDVGRYAHDIRSTSGQVGAMRLYSLATELEEFCKSDDLADGPRLVAVFKGAVSLTLDFCASDGLAELIANGQR